MANREHKIIFSLIVILFLARAITVEPSRFQGMLWLESQQQQTRIVSLEKGYRFNGVRDFRYASNGNVLEKNYHTRVYDPGALTSLWYGISYFGVDEADKDSLRQGSFTAPMAHVFLSFGFSNGDYLVLSIEARLQQQQQYHPVKGLLRQYEKTFVWATEQDVIGLRTHVRDEITRLYPLDVSKQAMQHLFETFVEENNQLIVRPAFYNTLIDNCMIGLARHAEGFSWLKALTTKGIVLPGYSDSVLLQEGLLKDSGAMQVLRQQAWVNPELVALNDREFSAKIRRYKQGD